MVEFAGRIVLVLGGAEASAPQSRDASRRTAASLRSRIPRRWARSPCLRHPGGERHAMGEEIAGLVAFLASPEAAIATGALHTIDGGFGS